MANANRGLGKGLGALLGDAALQIQEGGSVSLPIAQVEPGLKQPRKRFDDEALADLSEEEERVFAEALCKVKAFFDSQA